MILLHLIVSRFLSTHLAADPWCNTFKLKF